MPSGQARSKRREVLGAQVLLEKMFSQSNWIELVAKNPWHCNRNLGYVKIALKSVKTTNVFDADITSLAFGSNHNQIP